MGYLCFILLLTLVVLFSVMHLFGFHMMLIKNQTSTYNYIIEKRDKKQRKKDLAAKKQQQQDEGEHGHLQVEASTAIAR